MAAHVLLGYIFVWTYQGTTVRRVVEERDRYTKRDRKREKQ